MEQDRLGMSIAHLGQGVELGIGWGSVGHKRVNWSRSSPPRIVAQKRINERTMVHAHGWLG